MSDKKVEAVAQVERIRITLTSNQVKPLNKVSNDLINLAKQKNIPVRGPVHMPTKTLKITTRKTPCGEGSKTWDRLQMKIHKVIIDLTGATDIIQKINAITIEPSVYFEVTSSTIEA